MASLAVRYRPTRFGQIVGKNKAILGLYSLVNSDNVPPAILISGSTGTGKTTIARIVAKTFACNSKKENGDVCGVCEDCVAIANSKFPDVKEIDCAVNRGIDAARELQAKASYKPTKARKRVFILDECHQLTKEAFKSLLKLLEEPPESTLFILASSEPTTIPPEIQNRCAHIKIKNLEDSNIRNLLLRTLQAEDRHIDDKDLDALVAASGGTPREALRNLEVFLATGAPPSADDSIAVPAKQVRSWLTDLYQDPLAAVAHVQAFSDAERLVQDMLRANTALVLLRQKVEDPFVMPWLHEIVTMAEPTVSSAIQSALIEAHKTLTHYRPPDARSVLVNVCLQVDSFNQSRNK